jgi:glycosyltransferase involved in cell wall biosynthesis
MRIALASIHPRPLSGQIENLVGLAQALTRRNHVVEVVSAFPNDLLLGPERHTLTSRHKWSFVDHPGRVARIVRDLVRLSSRVDLIQLHLPTPAFTTLADLVQALVRVPVLVYYEAHLVHVPDLWNLERVRAAPEFYLPRLLINNHLVARLGPQSAARYLVSSTYQKTQLLALGIPPRRIDLVPNLLPYDKLVHIPAETARARLDLPAGRLLVYFGHYNHIKGVDVLVDAFRLLAHRFDDLKLVLAWSGVGHSPQVDALQQDPVLGKRVIQLGRVNVPELLAASDVVVLPYRLTIGQAVYPAALLEAMTANVPVVTSDLPLLRELTLSGETAELAAPEDPSALARAICVTLLNPARVQQMQSAQREWTRNHRPQHVVQDYERLYFQLLAPETRVLQPARNRADLS